ncbi:MAG: hypothetical protein R1F52_00805 [Candidatus Nitrosoabyssus spongiisocia]|nr:MAG: hypothetical protein R1F52_00805 [Nitrosopumilaceae archaeon AB1(1)]
MRQICAKVWYDTKDSIKTSTFTIHPCWVRCSRCNPNPFYEL